MSKELIIVTVAFVIIWVLATLKTVKSSNMLKYSALMSDGLIYKYVSKYNFYVRIKQLALFCFICYLIYYFCFK